MLNKKGFELATNFLVVLIISIAVIGFGIKFLYNLVTETSKLEKMSGEELDAKIGELLCADEQRVCVGIERKKIARGKADFFGLKILNIDEAHPEAEFKVRITNCQYKDGATLSDCPSSPPHLITIPTVFTEPADLSNQREIPIKKKDEATIAIGVEVSEDAPSTTYILDLDVLGPDSPTNKYVNTKKIYIEVP